MSDPVTLNPLDAAMAALKDAQAITRKCERDVWSAVACVGLDAKDRARTAEAERDAALADVTAWRGFAGSVAVAVHPDGTGAVIADHLAVDDLPDLFAAVERVVGEVASLRAERDAAMRDAEFWRQLREHARAHEAPRRLMHDGDLVSVIASLMTATSHRNKAARAENDAAERHGATR